ncbi:MAG: DUF2254 domain-containing protein [Natronospirillum sp.]
MKATLLKYWDNLRSSFWFLPSLMALGAIALSAFTVTLDGAVAGVWIAQFTYAGDADGAGEVMATIAGSMITITGVVFSMTLVALSLASSQLGPRLLSNFMNDKPNQVALGTFIATFIYCLMILRTIRRGEDPFVPHLSVTTGVLFALASLGVLIYFIHHVAMSIQADEVIARVNQDLLRGIDRLFPDGIGHEQPLPDGLASGALSPETFDSDSGVITSYSDGYLQRIDPDLLMGLAVKNQLVMRLEKKPGEYVVNGRPLIWITPAHKITDNLITNVNRALILGRQRTAAQDIEYLLNQLVEVAVRALSPGINDPFSAIACVDRLGSALYRLAQREMPSSYRFDEAHHLRLITPPTSLPHLMDVAFNQVRHYGRTSVAVSVRLLDTFALLAEVLVRPVDQRALICHADMVASGAHDALPEKEDRNRVEEHHQAVHRAINEFTVPRQTAAAIPSSP